jgi:hypothetical protein
MHDHVIRCSAVSECREAPQPSHTALQGLALGGDEGAGFGRAIGVQARDEVLEVDGVDVSRTRLFEVEQRLLGPPGGNLVQCFLLSISACTNLGWAL